MRLISVKKVNYLGINKEIFSKSGGINIWDVYRGVYPNCIKMLLKLQYFGIENQRFWSGVLPRLWDPHSLYFG